MNLAKTEVLVGGLPLTSTELAEAIKTTIKHGGKVLIIHNMPSVEHLLHDKRVKVPTKLRRLVNEIALNCTNTNSIRHFYREQPEVSVVFTSFKEVSYGVDFRGFGLVIALRTSSPHPEYDIQVLDKLSRFSVKNSAYLVI